MTDAEVFKVILTDAERLQLGMSAPGGFSQGIGLPLVRAKA